MSTSFGNDADFAPAPFWFLNHRLEPVILNRQIDRMAAMGVGGLVLHSRHGRQTPYLSEEWFKALDAAIDGGRRHGMAVWLYDEDNWPSGPAGMKTWENHHEFLMAYLYQHEVRKVEAGGEVEIVLPAGHAVALSTPIDEAGLPMGFPEGCELLDTTGTTLRWKAPRGPAARGYAVYVFTTTTVTPMAGFYDCKYLDLLNPEAVRHFIELTHEKYAERYQGLFGSAIKGIFTDEPACFYGRSECDVPYTGRLFDEFQARKGYDLRKCLPALFAPLGRAGDRVRIDFYDIISRLYQENFFKIIYEWCDEHEVEFIGHMIWEGELPAQVRSQVQFFRNIRYMHHAGVDHLGLGDAYHEFGLQNLLGPKFSSSAAHLLGKRTVSSEAFGEVGWTYDLSDLKRLFDSQLALGVNYIIPHAFYYSIQGFRKGECPPDESWRVPFCRNHYATLARYMKNACRRFTGGRHLGQIAVVMPYETWWARTIPGRDALPEEAYRNFVDLGCFLARGGYDWDIMDEEILLNGRPGPGVLEAGPAETAERFSVIIIPDAVYLGKDTIDRLTLLAEGGARIVLLRPDPSLEAAFAGLKNVVVTGSSLTYGEMNELLPDPNLRLEASAQGRDLVVYSYLKDGRLSFFLLNDGPSEHSFSIACRGCGPLYRRDLLSDALEGLSCGDNGTMITLRPMESVLLERSDADGSFDDAPIPVERAGGRKQRVCLEPEWRIDFEPANALVLKDWQCTFGWKGGREEGRGGWHRRHHLYRTVFRLNHLPGSCRLAVDGLVGEHVVGSVDKEFTLRLNGTEVAGMEECALLDPFIYWADVTSLLRMGKNELEVETAEPFYEGLHLSDPAILMGDFGVMDGEIVPPPSTLRTGDWVQQGFPHFAGTIVYRQTVQLFSCQKAIVFCRPADAARVIVNGADAGELCWSPWELDVTDHVKEGENVFEFQVSNGLGNLFVQAGKPAGLLEAPVIELTSW